MAIVSISRIQHRRGLQQNLPSLASAELGWSNDTQRLFIGNGTIAEGAPKLGNTEILTEHSDILRLAQTYSYKNEDAGYNPVTGGKASRFNAIAYNGTNLYVAVGNGGNVLTSLDSTTWTPVYANTSETLNDICYGNGLFVAVGTSGAIVYSTDGVTWNKASTTVLLSLTSIVYAGDGIDNYVAVASSGDIVISSDGSVWTTVTSPTDNRLNSVDYADNLLVAVGNGGVILHSSDSITWSIATSPTTINLESVKYNNDQWIATGESSNVIVSVDGANWGFGYTDTFRASAYASGGSTVFVGDGGAIYKTDDTSLSDVSSGTTQNLYDVIYASSKFVAVGANGTIIVSADDGVTWVAKTSGTSYDLNRIVYNGSLNKFVSVGNHGTILTSTDLDTWTTQTSGTTQNLYGISLWSTSTYIAVGTNGTVLTSPNGTAWTSRTSGITDDLEGIDVADLGGGTFKAIAAGTSGRIITSDDSGVTWLAHSSGVTVDLHSVRYISWTFDSTAYDYYFAVGNDGTVIASLDASSWSTVDFPTVSHMFNINYQNNRFWVVGSTGYTTVYGQHLIDIRELTSQSINILYNNSTGLNGPTLYSSSYGLGYYVVAGQYDTILVSIDGQNFYSVTARTFTLDNLSTADIYDCIFENNQFVAVGNKGLILHSANATLWDGLSYVYGNSTTVRTIQHKLDDFVSIKDFGAKGDGITDDTESINRALYEIYCRNQNPTARKILYFPGGRYVVSDSIKVPTNAIIKGEGANNTIFELRADPSIQNYVMITADSKQQIESQIGYNGATLPANICIEHIGIVTPSDGIWLTNSSHVTLFGIKFTGAMNMPGDAGSEYSGIYIKGSTMATPVDITINDCLFEKFNFGIFQPDGEYSRNIDVNGCSFTNLYTAIKMAKNSGLVNTMTVSHSIFDLVAFKAIDTNNANNLTSTFNSYRDVANNYLGNDNSVSAIIDFGTQSVGCASISDQFDRTAEEQYTSNQWVSGNSNTSSWFNGSELRVGLWEQEGGTAFTLAPNMTSENTGLTFRLNDSSYSKKVQYSIVRGTNTRIGTLLISYSPDGSVLNIDDDYNETSDVGVVLNLHYNGTTIDLQYTSTAGGSNFTLVAAKSYTKTVW